MEITGEISKKISYLAKRGEKFLFLIDFDGNGEIYTLEEAAREGIFFKFRTENQFGYTFSTNVTESPEANKPDDQLPSDDLRNRFDMVDNRISGDGTRPGGDGNGQGIDGNGTGKAGKSIDGKETTLEGSANNIRVFPMPFEIYLQGFYKAKKALHKGDTYLLNLTFATTVESDYSLKEIFARSNARYKLLYKDKFVVFSPERFISIRDGIIETNPMKGTIDASIPDAERKVLSHEKEHFEHNTIIDLLRNDLNMVAENVVVEKFRYVEKVTTHKGALLQVSSLIKGELQGSYIDRLGEIIYKLLPAGSVTGAPKTRTVEIIRQIENYNRGYYTGIFGYFDGENLDVAVAIRFIENINGQLFYKSGGGITALSDPQDEYNELLAKIYVPFV